MINLNVILYSNSHVLIFFFSLSYRAPNQVAVLVQEYFSMGDLFERLDRRPLSFREARGYMANIVRLTVEPFIFNAERNVAA